MVSHPRRLKQRFTPNDLVIVLAMIALLAGIGRGVYLKADEAARRARCADNLRAIGVGINNQLSSTGFYPLGRNAKTGSTLFYATHDRTDLGPARCDVPVAVYLCPSRRSPRDVRTLAADYGWASDPNSILGSPTPVRPRDITDGIGYTLVLGHLGIRPEDYGGGDWDSPWKTSTAYARSPAPLYPDRDVPDSIQWMGSPHPTWVPHLYADGSVGPIDYDRSPTFAKTLRLRWIYNRKQHIHDGSDCQ